MKRVEHPNGIDVFEFPDDTPADRIRAAFDEFDTRRNRQAAEVSQYQQLRDEMLRVQKTYSEEIAAVRHEAALARHEAAQARADAEQADALRWRAEERLQGNPEEIARQFAGREPGEPPSWLERRNDELRRKLQQRED